MYRLGIILFCLILLGGWNDASAQQNEYRWRLGVSGGYTNYHGDLSPHRLKGLRNWEAIRHFMYFNETYSPGISYQITLERRLTPTTGLMFTYGDYQFSMSDRYLQRDGTLKLDNPNFARGLNFLNHTRDFGMALVFKTDNNKLLSANSWIAPYMTLGAGIINFSVRGDLLDDDGLRYDQSILEPIHNGIFETDLPPLLTESDEGYPLWSWYAKMGLGIRFRLGKRIELFAQSDFMHTFTDFLDDVSGKYRTSYTSDFQAYASRPGTNVIDPENPYRGDPNIGNDWILYHGIGLKINFGASKKSFVAPIVATYVPDYTSTATQAFTTPTASSTEPDTALAISAVPEISYFYNIQMIQSRTIDSLVYASQLQAWEQEILKRENKIQDGQIRQRDLLQITQVVDEGYDQLLKDDKLTEEERSQNLESTRKARTDLRYSVDSISRRRGEMQIEIDSIRRLKAYYFPSLDVLIFQEDTVQQFSDIETSITERSMLEERDTVSSQVMEEIAFSDPLQEKAPEKGVDEAISPTPIAAEETAQEDIPLAGFQQTTEVQQIQAENEYLRAERDRVLSEYMQYQQENPAKSRKKDKQVIETETIVKTDDPTIVIEQDELEDGRRRKRWWWPFAAAGGVAATAAIVSSDRDDDEESEEIEESQEAFSEVTYSPIEPDQLAQAITAAMTGVVIDKEMEKAKEDTLIIEQEPILMKDTVFVEAESPFGLLNPKENVFFKVSQRVPDIEELERSRDLIEFVKREEDFILVLRGFADNTGSVNYNLILAEERMRNVGQMIIDEFGLDPEKIRYEEGGQIVRGTVRRSNDIDRRVEVRIERKGD